MSTKEKTSPNILNDSKKGNGSSLDPDRFTEGVPFKAKLIGYEEVPEARGEKMCQVSMAKLKAVVVAMKEHKRQISLNVSLEGLRIIDEKSEEIIHTHPVHRISFIFKDTGDSRAFGYVYHREDGAHLFFAIKTDKAADLTVTCIKELFESVYESRKKDEEPVTQPVTVAQDVEKAGSTDQVIENQNNPPTSSPPTTISSPPPSSDLFGLEEQQSSAQKPAPGQSNAWILSAFSQTQGPAYPAGGYPGQPVVVMGQQPLAFYPPQPPQGQQQQHVFQTPLNHPAGGWGAPHVGVVGGPAGFNGAMAPTHAQVLQRTSTVLSSASSSSPFTNDPFKNDPFKSDPFFSPVSHTPLSNNSGANQSLSFNQSSLNSTISSSGSFLESSSENVLFNTAFTETPAHKNQGAIKPTSANPPGPDPFADLAGFKLTSSGLPPPPNKKISKEDFNKEPPKPSLLDLSQQQYQQKQITPTQVLAAVSESSKSAAAAASNGSAADPFNIGVSSTNPFANISADDPFA